MIPNDTEQTTENISLVGQGIQQKFRFFENFVSLDLWSKMKKINHAGMVKISDFRSKDFRWFYGSKWYKTDSWRQVISRDWVYNKKFQIYCEFGFLVQNEKNRTFGQIFRFGVNKFSMILWLQMTQNGLLKTFYQSILGIQKTFSDLLRILWDWIFGPPKKIDHAGTCMVKSLDLG